MLEATHNILHYTFSHEFSLEGAAMIDTVHGEWRFDKRTYQGVLPRGNCGKRTTLLATYHHYNSPGHQVQ